jgi:hypothetical protein
LLFHRKCVLFTAAVGYDQNGLNFHLCGVDHGFCQGFPK